MRVALVDDSGVVRNIVVAKPGELRGDSGLKTVELKPGTRCATGWTLSSGGAFSPPKLELEEPGLSETEIAHMTLHDKIAAYSKESAIKELLARGALSKEEQKVAEKILGTEKPQSA